MALLWPCPLEPRDVLFPIMKTFGQVLDSADELTLEEQESLVSVLQRRVIERRRAELIRDVKEARQEFKAGKVRPTSVAEILKRIA